MIRKRRSRGSTPSRRSTSTHLRSGGRPDRGTRSPAMAMRSEKGLALSSSSGRRGGRLTSNVDRDAWPRRSTGRHLGTPPVAAPPSASATSPTDIARSLLETGGGSGAWDQSLHPQLVDEPRWGGYRLPGSSRRRLQFEDQLSALLGSRGPSAWRLSPQGSRSRTRGRGQVVVKRRVTGGEPRLIAPGHLDVEAVAHQHHDVVLAPQPGISYSAVVKMRYPMTRPVWSPRRRHRRLVRPVSVRAILGTALDVGV